MYLIKVYSLQAKTPLVQWGAREASPVPGDKGFQAPQDLWAGHWSSSAPSRRECWMVLSPVPSHHCPQRLEASICLQKNTESLQGFENQETILHFLENCILFQSSDLFQCGSHGVLPPSLFFWKWPGKFGCLQSPHQVTRPVRPSPGGPSFHWILTQTLRLRLKSPCFSIKNSHLLTFSSEHSCRVTATKYGHKASAFLHVPLFISFFCAFFVVLFWSRVDFRCCVCFRGMGAWFSDTQTFINYFGVLFP